MYLNIFKLIDSLFGSIQPNAVSIKGIFHLHYSVFDL